MCAISTGDSSPGWFLSSWHAPTQGPRTPIPTGTALCFRTSTCTEIRICFSTHPRPGGLTRRNDADLGAVGALFAVERQQMAIAGRGEMHSVVGEHGVDLVGHGLDQRV